MGWCFKIFKIIVICMLLVSFGLGYFKFHVLKVDIKDTLLFNQRFSLDTILSITGLHDSLYGPTDLLSHWRIMRQVSIYAYSTDILYRNHPQICIVNYHTGQMAIVSAHFFNNFSFSIAKNNIFYCKNRYNGYRKCQICVWWLSLGNRKRMNDFPVNKRSFAIAPIRYGYIPSL